MILMNKFARIYSYFPHLVFMLMFRLLLHDEKPVYAKNTLLAGDANSKTVRSSDNVLSDEGGGDVAEIFVAVIYPKSKETIFSRVIKQTVASLSADFTAATNWKVVPHYTAIDDNDGYAVQDIEKACAAWNHKPIIAAVVFSSFKSGFGHVLTSLHNNIPVLWATGEVQPGYFERVPLSRFEVRLDPGSYQVLRSLRSLLVATHWHAFTVMHTTTLLASRTYKDIISQPPLVPTILQFTSDSTSYYIFRLLSDVSKSTKGVIVLICEGVDAKRVIEESKKLNMVNGDFVWLWIDTGAMLLNDKSIKLDKLTKDTNLEATELRKVRHIPNLYVNENKTQTTSNRSKKILRNRDNNLVTSNNNNNNNNNVFCNHVNRSDVIYENKTDTKSVHNTSNEILLPNGKEASSSSASTINALMKHHFTLYRKKARRVAKDAEKITRSSTTNAEERKSVKLMNTAPIRLKSTNGGSSESTPLLLSVINDEPKNLSNGLINNGSDNNGRREKRAKFVKNSVSNTTTVSSPSPSIVSSSSASTTSTKRKQRNAKYLDMWKNMTRSARRNDDNRRSVAYASTAASRTAGSTNTIVKRLAAVHDDEHFDFGVPIFAENVTVTAPRNKTVPEMPVGILALQLIPPKVDKNYVKSTLKLLIGTLKEVIGRYGDARLSKLLDLPRISCFDFFPIVHDSNSIMEEFTKNLKQSVKEALAGQTKLNDTRFEESWNSSLAAKFKILNLVPEENIAHNKSGLHLSKKKANATTLESRKWRTIGSMVGEENVHLETIVWPGGDIIPVSTGRGSRSIFRIVTAFAPPFVMIGELDEDGQCLRGIECHQFLTSDKDNLTLLFNEMERTEEEIEVNVLDRIQAERSKHIWEGIDDIRNHHFGRKFKTNCCYGLSMDLLENVAEELEFDFQLYIVADGLFGSRTMAENGEIKWNGIVGDLISGAAHMSFSALSVSSSRAQFIDFSVPYFFSGVSFLAAPKESTDIPLLAFLLPFSPNLWIAIFTSLHVTAIAVAIYEWLSPFGLNPWGRQRSKNFGMASALWVMWGLLCGHLVQFKAPKSWPNKFLINVWGGFSVIFIASYTANIAALIAGLFFHTAVGDHHDHSLLSQRVAAPKSSAAEYYVRSSNQILWDHMQRYSVISVAEGVQLLKNGSLDILIADTPILDYYRATDHGCKLQKVGDTINEDTYAIGMMKGFPLKDSISAVIAKYATNGYIDILQEKWYGGLPCFKLATDMAQPRPLGVAAVAGVFLMLGLGVVVGCLILLSEHLFYKYTLPSLRKKPKSSIWKSRNVMFFSQKLYRFINCVELVSPHHAARELVHTLRQGQITSLFQKSVRRKEHEQRQQQQKSKAQFFEMIQEIRRVQQEERKDSNRFDSGKGSPRKKYSKNQQLLLSPTGLLKHRNRLSPGRLDFARRLSKDVFRSKSSGNLDVSRLGSDINVATGRFFDFYDAQAIGRRLSHGTADNSPPDLNTRRASQFLRDDISCTEPSPSDSDVPENNVPSKGISSSPSDSNLVKSPKSPTSAPSSSLSSNLFSPRSTSNSMFSRDIGPVAARKFSNVDSSSFRGIKSDGHKKISAPRLTLNNEEFISCEGGNCDEEEYRSSEMVRNNSVKSNEHIIEIVIPSESTEDGSHAEKCGDSIPRLNQRRRSSHADRENEISADPSTAAYDETGDDSKPKILLHFPKKKKDARTQCEDVTAAVPRSSSTNCPLTGALLRLSTEELLSLAQLSEKDLKRSLLKALDEKSST